MFLKASSLHTYPAVILMNLFGIIKKSNDAIAIGTELRIFLRTMQGEGFFSFAIGFRLLCDKPTNHHQFVGKSSAYHIPAVFFRGNLHAALVNLEMKRMPNDVLSVQH